MHQAWKHVEVSDNIELRQGSGDRREGGRSERGGERESRFGRDRDSRGGDRGGDRGGRERSERSGSRERSSFSSDRPERGDRGKRPERGGDRGERRSAPSERPADPNSVRLFINLGREQNVRPGDIVGAIAGEARIPGRDIGQIDIYDKFTFVNVPNEHVDPIIRSMKNNTIKGHKVNIEVAK